MVNGNMRISSASLRTASIHGASEWMHKEIAWQREQTHLDKHYPVHFDTREQHAGKQLRETEPRMGAYFSRTPRS